MIYPCKDCIVKSICSKVCDKITTENSRDYIVKNRCCPDCGGREGVEFTSVWRYFMCSTCYSLFRTSLSNNNPVVRRNGKSTTTKPGRLKRNLMTFGELIDKHLDIK
jgi:protein-arginine kinase activator protein McsA